MKLNAVFTKLENGNIRLSIKVVENEDYPTCNIFHADPGRSPLTLLPGEQDGKLQGIEYILGSGDCNYESWNYSNSVVAREALKHAITRLTSQLKSWRGIETPYHEEFNI